MWLCLILFGLVRTRLGWPVLVLLDLGVLAWLWLVWFGVVCADLGWSVLVLGGCGWLCVDFACLYSFGLICVRLGLGWLVVV